MSAGQGWDVSNKHKHIHMRKHEDRTNAGDSVLNILHCFISVEMLRFAQKHRALFQINPYLEGSEQKVSVSVP